MTMRRESDMGGRPATRVARWTGAAMALLAPVAFAAGEHTGHGNEVMCRHPMNTSQGAGAAPAQETVTRSTASYAVPEVTLISATGEKVSLRESLSQGPVMLNFIYTSCTTVCPAMSATFSAVRERLGDARGAVRMVSISIDPENDTPARLRDYAQRVRADAGWQFLTGSVADSITVQRAFDAYRGNKMNHAPLTLLRTAPAAPWVRIEGYASASTLAAEVKGMLPGNVATAGE